MSPSLLSGGSAQLCDALGLALPVGTELASESVIEAGGEHRPVRVAAERGDVALDGCDDHRVGPGVGEIEDLVELADGAGTELHPDDGGLHPPIFARRYAIARAA